MKTAARAGWNDVIRHNNCILWVRCILFDSTNAKIPRYCFGTSVSRCRQEAQAVSHTMVIYEHDMEHIASYRISRGGLSRCTPTCNAATHPATAQPQDSASSGCGTLGGPSLTPPFEVSEPLSPPTVTARGPLKSRDRQMAET